MVKYDALYGDRSRRHDEILTLSAGALHARFPFTVELKFNTTMTKKSGYSESQAKKVAASFLHGTKANGKPHQWVFGNQFGEVLPKFLMIKWQTIESGIAFGNAHGVETPEDQKDKLYAMVREAQLRDIAPLAITGSVPVAAAHLLPQEGGGTAAKPAKKKAVGGPKKSIGKAKKKAAKPAPIDLT